MTLLEFIISLLDILIWPIVVISAVFFLRHQLKALIPNLKSLKYKGLELLFEKGLEKVEKVTLNKPYRIKPSSKTQYQKTAESKFENLLEFSTNAAVLEAWVDIEQSLRTLAEKNNLSFRRGWSALYLTRMLTQKKILTKKLASMIDELRVLRNGAAHPVENEQISVNKARRYKAISLEIREELEALIKK